MSGAELVIHLTYKCPLACSHCCFSSDMSKEGHLSLEEVIQSIDEASQVKGMRSLEFVGGDPFLHSDLILAATLHARELGFGKIGAVTSAFWAGSAERALQELTPLVDAGFNELTISFDDMHAEFVKPKVVLNAFQAAMQLGLMVKIAVTLEPESEVDRDYILDLLDARNMDDSKLVVYETFVNSVGRAKTSATAKVLNARRTDARVYRGPCGSVLRNFSVTADRYVEPCCGVIPYQSELSIGTLGEEPLDRMIAKACDDPVMKWLAFEGPVAIMKHITRNDTVPRIDEDFDGICMACEALFSSAENVQKMHEALPEKLGSLALQETIYRAVGIFNPPDFAEEAPAAKTELV